MKNIAIIGAGITGLSAAYYLKDTPVNVDVYEASERAGGKIKTYREEGYTIELGPESYLSRKVIMTELAEELGLGSELVRNETGTAYIYANRRLSPLPEGTMLGIPTQILPFLKTKLISPMGKLRAALDLVKPVMPMQSDVTAGAFFRYRLGNEVLENLIEPLLSGVYGTDIDRLSLMSTFPNFKMQEEKYGSLIKGMLNSKGKSTTKKVGQFYQFKGGLQSFIDRLVDRMNASIYYNHSLEAIEKLDNGYRLTINGITKDYDYVIVTTPHSSYGQWFDDEPLEYFKSVETTSVATVVMVFDEDDVENKNEGTGFVVSRNMNTTITACTWTNKKWPHSTPKGKVVLRAYVGKPMDTIVETASDESIVNASLMDLRKIMTIKNAPKFSIVTRLPHSMPNYFLDHRTHVEAIESYMEANYPGLYLIGASHYAVGLPDCITAAKETVLKLNV